jgi:hypothetical protein
MYAITCFPGIISGNARSRVQWVDSTTFFSDLQSDPGCWGRHALVLRAQARVRQHKRLGPTAATTRTSAPCLGPTNLKVFHWICPRISALRRWRWTLLSDGRRLGFDNIHR